MLFQLQLIGLIFYIIKDDLRLIYLFNMES